MTALPTSTAFTGSTVTEAQFKAAITAQRDFLSGLFGSDGAVATALASLGALLSAYVAKTAAYTVVVGDRGKLIAASGTWTLSLPAAATTGAGFSLAVRNTGSGLITIDPNAAELINGAATVVLAPGHAVQLVCTGAGWLTVGALGSETVYFGDGTLAAPAISFPGDTNTGLFHPAVDQIAGVTNGIQRFLLGLTAFQLDLPMTGTAVVSGAYDATLGRLMTVGYGGLGAIAAIAETNLNLFPQGFAITPLGSALTNAPAGFPSAERGVVLTIGASGSQFQMLLSRATQRLWVRGGTSSLSEGTWRQLYHDQNILGTVSQTAGVPTGAIIERGTNANGDYVRFADGTQICHLTDGPALPSNTASGNIFTSASEGSWTFPAAFSGASNVVVGGSALVASRWVNARRGSGTTAVFRHYSAVASPTDQVTSLWAIGRWF